jgi:hypothetical protein
VFAQIPSKTRHSPSKLSATAGGIRFAVKGSDLTGFFLEANMWNVISCYLSRRHNYGVWCESGAIFLRCVHCGKRSDGWTVHAKAAVRSQSSVVAVKAAPPVVASVVAPRVLPFNRTATAR